MIWVYVMRTFDREEFGLLERPADDPAPSARVMIWEGQMRVVPAIGEFFEIQVASRGDAADKFAGFYSVQSVEHVLRSNRQPGEMPRIYIEVEPCFQ